MVIPRTALSSLGDGPTDVRKWWYVLSSCLIGEFQRRVSKNLDDVSQRQVVNERCVNSFKKSIIPRNHSPG